MPTAPSGKKNRNLDAETARFMEELKVFVDERRKGTLAGPSSSSPSPRTAAASSAVSSAVRGASAPLTTPPSPNAPVKNRPSYASDVSSGCSSIPGKLNAMMNELTKYHELQQVHEDTVASLHEAQRGRMAVLDQNRELCVKLIRQRQRCEVAAFCMAEQQARSAIEQHAVEGVAGLAVQLVRFMFTTCVTSAQQSATQLISGLRRVQKEIGDVAESIELRRTRVEYSCSPSHVEGRGEALLSNHSAEIEIEAPNVAPRVRHEAARGTLSPTPYRNLFSPAPKA